jgi:3-dehydroquinate dehydratase-1
MAQQEIRLEERVPRIVGSFGSPKDLEETAAVDVCGSCHIAEIRLDLLLAAGVSPDVKKWEHLAGFPLLFTARRQDEGGALLLSDRQRMDLLEGVLENAAMIDIEVASMGAMGGLITRLAERRIPWIASFHDFERLPATMDLELAAQLARDAGAAGFKVAARLHDPADLARLAEFQLADHGLPVATMGMGPLAVVSRLLNAQCGSVLNYGYLGGTATAPGQWDAALLGRAIARLGPFNA